ncbi:MAG: hypothetical protein ACQESF_05565 [Nanobdellota archaeon]
MNTIKDTYSKMKETLGEYKNSLYQGSKLAAIGLVGSCVIGCSGIKNVPTAEIPTTNTVTYEQLQKDSSLNSTKNKLFSGVSTDSFEKSLGTYFADNGYEMSKKKLDSQDGKLNETEPTKYDLVAAKPQDLTLPNNVKIEGSASPLESVLGGISVNELEALQSNYNGGYVGGAVSYLSNPEGNNTGVYIAVPEGNTSLLKALNQGQQKKIEDVLGSFEYEQIATHRAKQSGKTVAIMNVYEKNGNGGVVVPLIDAQHNGYQLGGVFLSDSEIGDLEDSIVSHKLEDNAKGRFASDILTGGGCAFINPVMGAGVFLANLYETSGYNDVTEFVGTEKFNPARSLDKSLLSEFTGAGSGSGVKLLYPVYEDDQVKGVIDYNVLPSKKGLEINPNGLYVNESGKLLASALHDFIVAGASVGLYELGRSQADDETTIKKIEENGGGTHDGGSGTGTPEVTGGGTHTGGSGVISR